MITPRRKASTRTTQSFRLFVIAGPTRSPMGDMAISAPRLKNIIPTVRSTAPARKQSRIPEGTGTSAKHSTKTIPAIGSTAAVDSLSFSRSFSVYSLKPSLRFLLFYRTYPFCVFFSLRIVLSSTAISSGLEILAFIPAQGCCSHPPQRHWPSWQ